MLCSAFFQSDSLRVVLYDKSFQTEAVLIQIGHHMKGLGAKGRSCHGIGGLLGEMQRDWRSVGEEVDELGRRLKGDHSALGSFKVVEFKYGGVKLVETVSTMLHGRQDARLNLR